MRLNRTACFVIRNLPIKKTEILKNVSITQKIGQNAVKIYIIENCLLFQKNLP